jgi:ACS family hexuronate transporter-like MFS transporter
LFTGSSFGAMVAPPLATWLDKQWGWRVAFLGTALAGLLWLPLWLALAFRGEGRRALDGEDAKATADRPSDPPNVLEVALHPAVLRGVVAVIASAPAISFALNWGAKYLVRDHHLTQADVGRYLWLPPLLFDVGSLAFGSLASSRARLRTDGSSPRALFAAAGALALAVAIVPLGGQPWPCIALLGVSLAGGGGVFAILTSDMMTRVPKNAVSTAGGITAAAQSLAYIACNPLVGRGVEHWQRYDNVLLGLALWILPGIVVWVAWRPPPPVSA